MNTCSFPLCPPSEDDAEDPTWFCYVKNFLLTLGTVVGLSYIEQECRGSEQFTTGVAVWIGFLGTIWLMTYMYVHLVASVANRQKIKVWNSRYKRPVQLGLISVGFILIVTMGWVGPIGDHFMGKLMACGL